MYDYDKSLQPNNSSNKLINLHEIYNRLKLLIKRLIFIYLAEHVGFKCDARACSSGSSYIVYNTYHITNQDITYLHSDKFEDLSIG